eukprot:TRINITY_DN21207_c0_g3_i1.p1 TRINITY_DN21207_c0_g3~~TRINITY_DN21207_c0_g3_i1.p1  ORF type:complete len:774 (+),score=113.42 TRINITY_DN21207_c0_g3_i1:98-2419(+)
MTASAPGAGSGTQPQRRGAWAVALLAVAIAVTARRALSSRRRRAWKLPTPQRPAQRGAPPRLTLAGDLPAAPGEPVAPYPVLRDVLHEQLEHGFHGVVALRPNLSECVAAPNVSTDWLAETFIVGAQGPLLYRGGCRWSLASSAWCAEAGGTGDGSLACAERATRSNLEGLANGSHAPDCWLTADHEGPLGHDGGGQLSVLRTPRSAHLLAVHRLHWPLRLDWCGVPARWGAHRYARLILPGERSLTEGAPQPTAAELAAERWEIDHWLRDNVLDHTLGRGQLAYVSLLVEIPSHGGNRHIIMKPKTRVRRSKTGRVFGSERFDFTLWPDAAGPQRHAVVDRLARHLADDRLLGIKQDTGRKRFLTYQLSVRSNTAATPWPPVSCLQYVTDPVVALPAPGDHRVMQLNLGHWATEALYTLYNARVRAGEYVGLWPADSWYTWHGVSHYSPPLLRVVHTLIPLRLSLGRHGLCLQRLRLHVHHGWPTQNAGEGLRAFARRIWGMPPEPLPAPAGARLTATLVLRRPGGTRCITNWAELRDSAAAQNWELQLPLIPGPNMSSFTARLTEIAEAVSRSHVLAAMHGAELSLAVFAAAAGSILVEICPWGGVLRFSDLWFASYAFTVGIHVMRWYVPPNATEFNLDEAAQYPEQWKAWHEGPRPGKGWVYSWRMPVARMATHLEFVKRTRSNTTLPVQGWRRLLRKARALLELQHREPGTAEIRGLPHFAPHPVAGNTSAEAQAREVLRRAAGAAERTPPAGAALRPSNAMRLRHRR